jgi:hypothetical protein
MSHNDMLHILKIEHPSWSNKFFKQLEDNHSKCMAIFYKYNNCSKPKPSCSKQIDWALLEQEYKASKEHADYMFEEA